jgi:cephalosporin hydroxylase
VSDHEVVAAFHRLFYNEGARTWSTVHWLGVKTQKCPLDLWIYQELLVATRPDVVIETGTAAGGSALFLASMFDLLGDGRVITIDVDQRAGRPEHPRIDYVAGSSTDSAVVNAVLLSIPDAARVMVVLDSDHARDHVSAELAAYAPRVAPGCYLIVEDTNLNGSPVAPGFGPGPGEAVRSFLVDHSEFEVDRACERLLMTFNPGGYLRRR